jgi:hypothetical protein
MILVMTLWLAGCATTIEGPRYQTTEPRFDLFSFFDGPVKAWGLVQGRDGELIQRFEVEIDGSVQGDQLTLDETFTYGFGDGVESRVWTITRGAGGRYTGRAGDVLGEARGTSYGNAFHWQYAMDIPVRGQTLEVQFSDWFWALDETRIMNRSYIQKLGFDVAEVTIFMEQQ